MGKHKYKFLPDGKIKIYYGGFNIKKFTIDEYQYIKPLKKIAQKLIDDFNKDRSSNKVEKSLNKNYEYSKNVEKLYVKIFISRFFNWKNLFGKKYNVEELEKMDSGDVCKN